MLRQRKDLRTVAAVLFRNHGAGPSDVCAGRRGGPRVLGAKAANEFHQPAGDTLFPAAVVTYFESVLTWTGGLDPHGSPPEIQRPPGPRRRPPIAAATGMPDLPVPDPGTAS
jgi:hypothetical protein